MEAQAELESIVQCPMGGIFRARIDRDFTLIYANDHYYALHGITRESLRNRLNNGTIHLVHPADIPFIERRLHKAVEQKEQTVSLEYRVVRPDEMCIRDRFCFKSWRRGCSLTPRAAETTSDTK